MCGAPDQAVALPPGTDLTRETVLNGTGEFTAEVVSSASGDYRFFAAPGTWTVRALSRSGNGQTDVNVGGPGLFTTEVSVSA